MKKLNWFFKILSVLIAFSVCWIFFAPFLANRLIFEKKIDKADVIVILGGSSVLIERTHKAAEVFSQGVSQKILITDDGGFAGWSKTEGKNLPFFELSRRELIAKNVHETAIEVVKPAGDGTNYEAKHIAEIAKTRGWKSILIVTSGYHSRRAFWTFEKYFKENGLETEIGIVSPIQGIQTPTANSWWYSKNGWKFVGGEYLKSAYYWLFL